MANLSNLPPTLIAQIAQVRANIPAKHREMPVDNSVVASVETALLHINDWSFLNGYAYVNVAGSEKERRWRYSCIFHSRKEGEDARNSRKTEAVGRQRLNTHTRGISCPVGITVRQYVDHGAQRLF
jgi:hypothetical protein